MTSAPLSSSGPAWWPLSLLKAAGHDARMRRLALLWLAGSLLAVGLAVVEARRDWSGIPVDLGGFTFSVTVYPPLFVTLLVAFWLGPAWGAVPAYLATLVSALIGGIGFPLAALFALATPVEILIVWGAAALLDLDADLRNVRDWATFAAVGLVAAAASSLAGLIWIDAHNLDVLRGQHIWEGWILGDLLQIGIAVPLVLRLAGPRVRPWIDRQFPAPPRRGVGFQRSVALVVGMVVVLSLLVLQGVRMVVGSLHIPPDATTPEGEPLLAHLREIGWFMGTLIVVTTATVSFLAAALARVGERARNVALRDELTGCFNRRAFYQLFQKEGDRSRRLERGISLLQFDVDHFKQVNDSRGHEAGDEVLRQVVRRVQQVMREHDLLFRWGGDEFLVLLPHTAPEDAAQLAERLRASVAAEPFGREEGARPIPVTVSIGAVGAQRLPVEPDQLIGLADVACYLAKQRGRNQVVAELADTGEWSAQA